MHNYLGRHVCKFVLGCARRQIFLIIIKVNKHNINIASDYVTIFTIFGTY